MPLREDGYTATLAIIGGGAAGLYAGCVAADLGLSVSVWEAGSSTGRKILATGNGRCNYTNRILDPCLYSSDSGKDFSAIQTQIARILEAHSPEDTIAYLNRLGVFPLEQNGYMYPRSNQASTVRNALVRHLEQKGVKFHHNSKIHRIQALKPTGFAVTLESGYTFLSDAILLACGGSAAPKTGSDGSGYILAEGLGHHRIPDVPALTYLASPSPLLPALHGVRCSGALRIRADQVLIGESFGEIQFTKNGISGIPAFQVSRHISRFLQQNPGGEILCEVDLLATEEIMEGSSLWENSKRVHRADSNICHDDIWFYHHLLEMRSLGESLTVMDVLKGIFPEKMAEILMKDRMDPSTGIADCREEDLHQLTKTASRLTFPITGTGDMDSAQVTAGGMDLAEMKPDTLESIHHPGLFFAGEILDVDGPCGGYNLQWAWSSGAAAARGAAEYMGRAFPIPDEVCREYPRTVKKVKEVTTSTDSTISSVKPSLGSEVQKNNHPAKSTLNFGSSKDSRPIKRSSDIKDKASHAIETSGGNQNKKSNGNPQDKRKNAPDKRNNPPDKGNNSQHNTKNNPNRKNTPGSSGKSKNGNKTKR